VSWRSSLSELRHHHIVLNLEKKTVMRESMSIEPDTVTARSKCRAATLWVPLRRLLGVVLEVVLEESSTIARSEDYGPSEREPLQRQPTTQSARAALEYFFEYCTYGRR